jgi:enterochelin esterase family protein
MKIKASIVILTIAAAATFAIAQTPAPPAAAPQAAASSAPAQSGAPAPAPPRYQEPMPPGPDPNSQYRLGPDSMAQDGVPKGEVRGPLVLPSQVFPGTAHTYWVYVPAQYDPSVPVALMIFQDGQGFKETGDSGEYRAPNVLDNLIYRHEIPVMIAVFIDPGKTPEQPEPNPADWGDRSTNRPTEYNTPNDKYSQVIIDELMPALYKDYNISKDPDMHGIGGSSSGAIAAFGVAWFRPDEFHKVLSVVGSFVDIRGGQVFADWVAANDKKPIRIFMVDGRNDHRGTGPTGVYNQNRDWFYQNVRLMRALTAKGYDVNYSWSMNLHGNKYGGPMLPDMMRWLWRDGPVSLDPNDMTERAFRAPYVAPPASASPASAPSKN